MKNFVTKTVDLRNGDELKKRLEIQAYFEKTWALDEKLYTQLKSDDVFYHRGDPLRHIILFYLGHTAVFFINKLLYAKIINQRVNRQFESIFAIGVDEMSWDDLDERHYEWPSVEAVRAYRNEAKKVILDVIGHAELKLPVTWNDPFWIIMMGIEHARIHIETSSVLIRQLPLDDVVSGRFGEICEERGGLTSENEFLPVSGAEVQLGKSLKHPLYGWDNEYGHYSEHVEDFKASKFLISNAEFLEFVNDNGYATEKYWTEEGWNWKTYKNAEMPLFWQKRNDEYFLRLVADEISMPWNWPVEVNYLEAKAYCNWLSEKKAKKYRLPSEAEWYRLADISKLPDETEWAEAPGNINLEHYASPCPVDKFKMGDFYDVIGNVWQWTESPITGFPGFKVHPVYDDFSTPTFDGKHNMIKGGSWISTGNEATYHARYAFRRHFYQHAGFRVVESEHDVVIRNDEYETDVEVANACYNQWKIADKNNFSVQLAKKIKQLIPDSASKTLLDLNTDTGRLAFELAGQFSKITAIDFSARFIRMPIQLQEKGFNRFVVQDEGELMSYHEVQLAETGLGAGKDKILFMQDNANNLKPVYTGYDVIVVPDLLEELTNPVLFLTNIHERLNAGGMLILTSSYDWDKNHIANTVRPGGFKIDGEIQSSFEGIKQILSENFVMQGEPENLQKVLRVNSRKSELYSSELTVWLKK